MSQEKKLKHLSAVILAGGASTRMGQDKAFLPFQGKTLIEVIHGRLQEVFPEVMISARDADRFRSFPWTVIPDLLPVQCPLSGIHASLRHSTTDYTFVAGCDMPWLDTRVIRTMAAWLEGRDIVTIESSRGLEPLHSFYSKRCLPKIEEYVRSSKFKLMDFLNQCTLEIVRAADLKFLPDPDRPFQNLNTEKEYKKILRDSG